MDYVLYFMLFHHIFPGNQGWLHIAKNGLCVIKKLIGQISNSGVWHNRGGPEGRLTLEELDFGVVDLLLHLGA